MRRDIVLTAANGNPPTQSWIKHYLTIRRCRLSVPRMVVVGLLVLVCILGAALAVTIPAARRADANHDAPLGDPFNPGPSSRPPVECECGKQLHAGTRDHHVVAALFTDDAHLAGEHIEGGTAMVADYCPEHCPGGCDKGCPVPLKAFP